MRSPLPLLALLFLSAASTPRESTPPSLLLVIADDVGAVQLGSYGHAAAAQTPHLDALAAAGVRFTEAHANPVCSPMRATMATGRYGFRTGILNAIGKAIRRAPGLQASEVTVWESLAGAGFSTWYAGKWHLGDYAGPLTDPATQGVQDFRGAMGGGMTPGYVNWPRVVNGVQAIEPTYATLKTTTDALEMMAAAPEPWFGTVSYNAAHRPWHDPPGFPTGGSETERYQAMVESLDLAAAVVITEAVRMTEGRVLVLFVGDNGFPSPAVPLVAGCPNGQKSLPYRGGTHVPLIAFGAGVVDGGRTWAEHVSAVDIFATLLELGGAQPEPSALDSVSFAGVLSGAASVPTRPFVYTEEGDINGLPVQLLQHERAVSDGRYKLIVRRNYPGPPEELYDLATDPCETAPLDTSALSGSALSAYNGLRGHLSALGVL